MGQVASRSPPASASAACLSLASSRPLTATRAPCCRNNRADARPMPLPPPVRNTTLPCSWLMERPLRESRNHERRKHEKERNKDHLIPSFFPFRVFVFRGFVIH